MFIRQSPLVDKVLEIEALRLRVPKHRHTKYLYDIDDITNFERSVVSGAENILHTSMVCDAMGNYIYDMRPMKGAKLYADRRGRYSTEDKYLEFVRLDNAFNWDDTPMGHSFWGALNNLGYCLWLEYPKPPLPEKLQKLGDYEVSLNDRGDVLTVGCQQVPFDYIKGIYELMESMKEKKEKKEK